MLFGKLCSNQLVADPAVFYVDARTIVVSSLIVARLFAVVPVTRPFVFISPLHWMTVSDSISFYMNDDHPLVPTKLGNVGVRSQ